MIKLYRTLMAAFVLAAVSASASAAPIVGQLGLTQTGGVITTTPAGSLAAPGIVINVGAMTGETFNLPNPGNFSVVPAGTAFSFAPTSINTASLAGLQLTIAGSGTFTASSGSVTVSSTDLIRIVLNGNYTTAGTTAGFQNNTGTLSLVFQRVTPGADITFTGSLITPVVPEPSSVALAGIGMAAAGLFGLRKRLAK